ncbi:MULTISPECIES: flavin reductase family protein [unclassified Rhodococcus (in: high G+C Gram-positive bacteria)]|uniref:flavin reductase family protein n=1 Tax=unclassified Rhodococcus (in: high G+C Gram-positive bacteria) TaxID=192944 RepID=UPI0005E9DE6E|nr:MULTISPECIES: flavin reductase family protein [unclassified Rhodococcus (in: high G+C Gram-positive bacteria)]KJF19223.1 Flavin-dependent monooxygenase, reductase subunit HsaB [Rhodococcus sp. AD45]
MTTALWTPEHPQTTGETSPSTFHPRVDPATIRRAMSRVPTSVAVVTASLDGEPVGMTIGSLTSVSLDPPLVAFFVFSGSSTFAQLRRCEQFCINVLAEDQAEICHGFARRDGGKFELGEWKHHEGVPRIANAVATVLCERESVFEAGDHLGMLGRVTDIEFSDNRPLLYYRGQTSQLHNRDL